MSQQLKPFFGKVIIRGIMQCKTGLHIGQSKDSMDIGGIDAPVVRDPITRAPYIPGSSCKGKLRSLLERRFNKNPNRNSGKGIYRHECDDTGAALACEVCRIFGSTGRDGGDNHPGQIIVRDMHLTENSLAELDRIETGLSYTEWKFENTLDRVTSTAMPRQIERVPAGSEFTFEIIYNVEDLAKAKEDVLNIIHGLNLLEDDFLGGHGSRGYGKVQFKIDCFEGRKIEYYSAVSSDEQNAMKSEAREGLETPEGRIQAVHLALQKITGNGVTA